MRFFSTILSATLLWHTAKTAKTTFNDDGSQTVQPSFEDSYPDSITIPHPSDSKHTSFFQNSFSILKRFIDYGPGPASNPFPAPVTWSKAEMLGAYRQALQKATDLKAPYPSDWKDSGVNTGYKEFPISKDWVWTIGEPGPYRLLYKGATGEFYAITVHANEKDANSGENYVLCTYHPSKYQKRGTGTKSAKAPTCQLCSGGLQKRGGRIAVAGPSCKALKPSVKKSGSKKGGQKTANQGASQPPANSGKGTGSQTGGQGTARKNSKQN